MEPASSTAQLPFLWDLDDLDGEDQIQQLKIMLQVLESNLKEEKAHSSRLQKELKDLKDKKISLQKSLQVILSYIMKNREFNLVF